MGNDNKKTCSKWDCDEPPNREGIFCDAHDHIDKPGYISPRDKQREEELARTLGPVPASPATPAVHPEVAAARESVVAPEAAAAAAASGPTGIPGPTPAPPNSASGASSHVPAPPNMATMVPVWDGTQWVLRERQAVDLDKARLLVSDLSSLLQALKEALGDI